MNLTDRLTQLMLGTLVAGLTLAPATLAGAQPEPGGNGDLTSEEPCQPDWEPCGPSDPCEEDDECEPPAPCDDVGDGVECPTPPESCDDEDECPDPETDQDPDPDPDPQTEPVDPPVVARPNFTG